MMNVFEEFKRLVSELEKQRVRHALVGGGSRWHFTQSRNLPGRPKGKCNRERVQGVHQDKYPTMFSLLNGSIAERSTYRHAGTRKGLGITK